ncbi:hypothetical protein Sulac_1715 [Sulfobacillus acidophilus DSM 10332]|uniref:Holin n=1 Tax=Sulfobacillus acidophilus (strain ATCC 700253 / DSM 10332 / NAL) TaxID=679936 RepID=G8TZH1_SULAD|nr:hypothetical protein Sulac_1715 [Sulfobacillus acidophilus DSM 10332]
MTHFGSAFGAEISANGTLFVAVLALAGLDLVLGVGRALAAKRFASGMLRLTAAKLIQELGLPLLLAVLGVADPAFASLVGGALWLAIVAEATSIVEQMRGKQSSTLIQEVIKLLAGLHESVPPANASQTNAASPQQPPTGGN